MRNHEGQSMDRGDIIGVTPEVLDAFSNAVTALQTNNQTVERMLAQRFGHAAVFEAFSVFNVPPGPPQILVGYDLSRLRLLVRASAPDVFIGKQSQLASGFGFPIDNNSYTEILTTDQIFVAYKPDSDDTAATVNISLWIEKSVE